MNCHNFAENYYEVNLLILLLTVALNSWAATIVHRLSFIFSHNILVLFVGNIMIMISGKTYCESFSLFRKERNGLNAAIVLDCIANSLTMVASIHFIDQLFKM